MSETVRKGVFDVSIYEGEESMISLGYFSALVGTNPIHFFLDLFLSFAISLSLSLSLSCYLPPSLPSLSDYKR